MALDPTLEEQAVLADTYGRATARINRREIASEALAGLGFVAVAVALWWLRPPGAFSVWPGVMCTLVLAASTLIEFDTPFGFTVPTQLAFVPLLFAVPPAVVPVAVAAALVLACVPKLVAGRMLPSRLLRVPANGWFAIGPVLVFEIANVEPARAWRCCWLRSPRNSSPTSSSRSRGSRSAEARASPSS